MLLNCAYTSKEIEASFNSKWQPINKKARAPYKLVTATTKCILNQCKIFIDGSLKNNSKGEKPNNKA